MEDKKASSILSVLVFLFMAAVVVLGVFIVRNRDNKKDIEKEETSAEINIDKELSDVDADVNNSYQEGDIEDLDLEADFGL